MKHIIKLHTSKGVVKAEANEGDNLLKLIQEHDNEFAAPCGGNGSCGKCQVEIKGQGHVTSCLHTVTKNIEVVLPKALEMKVLSAQYKHSKQVWTNPGASAFLADIPYGLAVDIGTTTMVFYVVNLMFGGVVDVITMANPQAKYGADVISRILASTEIKDGNKKLQKELITAVNKVVNEYCNTNSLPLNYFVKIAFVGNTTMLHNLMGEDVLTLAHAPFTPVFLDSKKIKAKEIGINIHEEGEVVLAPSLSAYIGGDILAGIASLDTTKLGKKYLFIDIGTNGEMALINDDRILSCATAAGPAFEGANISCGMSASTGAISKYSDKNVEVVGDVEATGICGSGLIDVVSTMIGNDVLQYDGNISSDFVIANAGTKNVIALNQADIREIQLAKSAVQSGIKRLLDISGITADELDHVLLAGGFGNYIDIKSAVKIGLLPDVDLDKYIQIGNSAGTGAVLALKSEGFVDEMNMLQKKMEYIELSTDEEFTMEFAMNMFF
ncbi:MAG: DUF4445 domain-containing protein [Ichthyobacteriaceae bacterium]|nr:DUF4445 domain-containing protein [Ichthyobacteriaceae bacterium]